MLNNATSLAAGLLVQSHMGVSIYEWPHAKTRHFSLSSTLD
jgi:hypothetical protein